MIRHLTAADFKTMPWANGKGMTVEMARADDAQGMLWRLSRAAVVENGDFSIFPGIDRNLTVISGPGFDLVGGVRLRAGLLAPVAFPGDVAVAAQGVVAPCEDFNVMVRRGALRAEVTVQDGGQMEGGLLALLALEEARIGGQRLAPLDLALTDAPVTFEGRVIAVRLARL